MIEARVGAIERRLDTLEELVRELQRRLEQGDGMTDKVYRVLKDSDARSVDTPKRRPKP